jgi:hypothetical protein
MQLSHKQKTAVRRAIWAQTRDAIRSGLVRDCADGTAGSCEAAAEAAEAYAYDVNNRIRNDGRLAADEALVASFEGRE